MILKTLALCAALALASPACARPFDQRLRDLPKAEEVIYCGLAVADSALTASILDRGGHEKNPLLGRHPSKATLSILAVAKCAGHAAITSALQDHAPARAVRVWEVLSIAIQGKGVVGNLVVRF